MKSERTKPARRKNPSANRLTLARDFIQRHRRKDALEILDAHLNANSSSGGASGRSGAECDAARVAALLGDYEKKRGRFAEAAEYYALAAAQLPADEPRAGFRASLGHVRALIAQPAVDAAFVAAREALERAKGAAGRFDDSTDQALIDLRENGRIEIGPRPLRPSVAATRLGEAFHQAGEWEMAEFFFKEALQVNPQGGSRARQSLAKIALAANRPAEAETRAQEALLVGKFRAKTLAAWPLLISSRARQGKAVFTREDKAGLRSAIPSVRARAVLVICKAMRPHGDAWMDLAADWSKAEGNDFPAIRFELEKMLRAEARLAGVVTRDQAALALQQARTKNAAPSEVIAAGKAYVRTLLLTGSEKVQWELVSNHLAKRHGKGVVNRSIHGMALAAMEAKRYDLARGMLKQIRASVPPTRVQWMRSTWALARMETALDNHAAVYAAYGAIAQNPASPSRFRAQALLRALRAAEAGKLEVPPTEMDWLHKLVREERDHRVVLDLGRQFNIAGATFISLREEAADRAAALATEKLAGTSHPATALAILLELNRRQFFDLWRAGQVVAQFENYALPRLDWLWSTSSAFWEWYGVVVRSTGRVNGWRPAETLAKRYLADPGTPVEGRAMLAVSTGLMLVAASRHRAALPYFAQAIQDCPDAMTVGAAYYWHAVACLADEDKAGAKRYAEALRRCYKTRPSFGDEWRYDSQAALILNNMNIEAVRADNTSDLYGAAYLQEQVGRLNKNVERVIKSGEVLK
jgi:tetratricopeptide (TPR) repeat protein